MQGRKIIREDDETNMKMQKRQNNNNKIETKIKNKQPKRFKKR